ncbi:Chromosome segregation protein Spc25 [Nakaseomyces glabratus]
MENNGKSRGTQLVGQIDDLTRELQDAQKVVVSRINERNRLVSDMMERYRSNLRILQEQRVTVLSELDRYKEEESRMKEALQNLNSTKEEFKSEMDAYQLKAEKMRLQKRQLQKQLDDLNKMFADRANEIQKYKEMVTRQRQLDSPEIKLYEKLLGLQIDKADTHMLKFTFTDFGREREYKSVIVDVSQLNDDSSPLRIKEIESGVSASTVNELETVLNQQGIVQFLIEVRKVLVKSE